MRIAIAGGMRGTGKASRVEWGEGTMVRAVREAWEKTLEALEEKP